MSRGKAVGCPQSGRKLAIRLYILEWICKNRNNKKTAETTLNALVEIITEELKKGEKIQLVGFGTFETRKRAARKGRNPQTGEEMKFAAAIIPVFKAGKALKDIVNKKI